VYLDNVDVNGVLPSAAGPSIWELLVLFNSRLLDFLFKLQTVPFRGDYMSANKQFIAPLPIKLPDGDGSSVEGLGRNLHEVAAECGSERKGFLDWLKDRIGADPRLLPGKTKLSVYDSHSTGELLDQLAKSAKRLTIDPHSRVFRDEFDREHSASVEKLRGFRRDLTDLEAKADELVYDVYGVSRADRALISDGYKG